MSTHNGYVRPATDHRPPPPPDPREAARARARRAMRARQARSGQAKQPSRTSIAVIPSAPAKERRRARMWLVIIAVAGALAMAWGLLRQPESAVKPATGTERLAYVCYDHVSGRRYGKVTLEVPRAGNPGAPLADPAQVLARCNAVYGMGMDRAGFELETWVQMLKDANRYPPGANYR